MLSHWYSWSHVQSSLVEEYVRSPSKTFFSWTSLSSCLMTLPRVTTVLKDCQTVLPLIEAGLVLLHLYTGESQTGGSWMSSPKNMTAGRPPHSLLLFMPNFEWCSIQPSMLHPTSDRSSTMRHTRPSQFLCSVSAIAPTGMIMSWPRVFPVGTFRKLWMVFPSYSKCALLPVGPRTCTAALLWQNLRME